MRKDELDAHATFGIRKSTFAVTLQRFRIIWMMRPIFNQSAEKLAPWMFLYIPNRCIQ